MLNELINIKEEVRIPFRRHFIRNVVLELAFDDLNKNTLLDNREKIQNSFKSLGFNNFGEMKHIELKMSVENDIPEQITNDNKTVGLLLFDDNRKIRVELLSNRIIVSIFKYLNFDTFVDDIEKMINILREITPKDNHVKMISLSKQNTIISTDTTSFEDLIFILNKPFLSSMRESIIPFENFEYTRDEFNLVKNNYNCKIGSNCLKRKNKGEYEINLDISVVSNESSAFETITEQLKGINNFIFSIFCWATTDKFKSIMNEDV